jgi:hypothetical protein
MPKGSKMPMENPDFDPELVIEIGRELTPTWGL